MKNFNLSEPKSIHFIGIGGISMSGLAELMLDRGFRVSGSDFKRSPLTDALSLKGADIYYDQSVSNIPDDTELVVYTAAIPKDSPELEDARLRGIEIATRADFLGQVMKSYPMPIAVSGTHGKTTTTSMVSEILLQAGTDPTISIGGILPSIGGNFRVGGGDIFLTEACEYTNSFLSFFPKISIILNIDADHLDFFEDLEDIRSSFRNFAELLPEDGLLIINGDIPRFEEITRNLKCKVTTVGALATNDYYAANIRMNESACAAFDVITGDNSPRSFILGAPGLHNVYNSLAAIAAADYLGIDEEKIKKALLNFSNSKRRFEYKGNLKGIQIYDDYAHHPTEINAAISTALEVPHRELWVIFQPHTYSRTKLLLKDFAVALSKADHVILPDIYAAREKADPEINSELLKKEISALGCDCHYIPDFSSIQKFVLENCTNNDLLITMGAGDVVTIGEELLA